MPRPAGILNAIVVAAGLCAGAISIAAQDRPLPALDVFLANVRAHLRTDRTLLSQYTYLQRSRDLRFTKTGTIAPGAEKLYQIYPGLHRRERYERLMAVDGKPRDPADLAEDDRKHQKKVLDDLAKREHESAGDREKRLKAEAKELREEQDEVDDVFQVYDFRLVERQVIEGQSMIVVDFSPKPGATAKTDDGKMLTKAKGRAWVSEDDYELARLEAEMIADVRVALFLAKLYKGTTVSVDRRKVNGEVWLPARVQAQPLRTRARAQVQRRVGHRVFGLSQVLGRDRRDVQSAEVRLYQHGRTTWTGGARHRRQPGRRARCRARPRARRCQGLRDRSHHRAGRSGLGHHRHRLRPSRRCRRGRSVSPHRRGDRQARHSREQRLGRVRADGRRRAVHLARAVLGAAGLAVGRDDRPPA